MASRLYRGDSVPVAQVTKITPANVLVGDTFTITCNGKSVVYVALAATVADVVAGLIAALGRIGGQRQQEDEREGDRRSEDHGEDRGEHRDLE
jgi:hypothetical protein